MRYNDILKDKTLFVYSDAAGKNTITSIASHVDECDIVTFRGNKLAEEGHVQIDFSKREIEALIKKIEPELIFLGTSVGNKEAMWIETASELSIETNSFVDHFTNYIERFTENGRQIYPNKIFVLNEIAKEEAVIAGVPKDKIDLLRNPYYYAIESYQPQIDKRAFLDLLKIGLDSKILLFVSDCVAENLPEIGFDEYSSLEHLLDELTAEKRDEKIHLLIKLHPEESEGKFSDLIAKYQSKSLRIQEIANFDPLLINWYSDRVIGMFSNMIIEAMLINKPVLRIEIGQRKELLKFDEKTCVVVKEIEQLKEELMKFID